MSAAARRQSGRRTRKARKDMSEARIAWLALAITLAPVAALAADDFAYGRRLFLEKAQCSYCHGWAGDGSGDPRSPGIAANLRNSALTRDQLVEVIMCGRPGTAM